MAAHRNTTLDERSEKLATVQNHFIADPCINLYIEVDKSSELQSMVQILTRELQDSHADTSAEILLVDNHCSSTYNPCILLIDQCDTLHMNKLDYVQFITHAELFTRISPAECLSYNMLDKTIEINSLFVLFVLTWLLI
ncbi:hypothetical protein BAE44_0009869 [Dichanthelium oligosanthes]|uniref:Uncharacterized protein n=1 Tax=Dichanthelium oligosanthes TaxID=888268 RepID=A0A1E5VVJ4_9POAL|nr:hypothetical protein BAE44_0009869 [Dichanthelium oligosanthes]